MRDLRVLLFFVLGSLSLQTGFASRASITMDSDGTIKWEQEKIQRRISIETYDNDTCKRCKLLPLCYGPCCQKQIESFDNGKTISDMCQLRKLEIPLKDYLIYRLKSELNRINQ